MILIGSDDAFEIHFFFEKFDLEVVAGLGFEPRTFRL